MRKRIRHILSIVLGSCYRLLCKIKVCRPKVIMYMDGGICSQMNQYLEGQIYAELGVEVGYDVSWFKTPKTDVDGRFPRVYELTELFPEIKVKTFTSFTTHFYRLFLRYTSSSLCLPPVSKEIAPIYLGGYYIANDEDFTRLFNVLYLGQKTMELKEHLRRERPDQHLCAVHVRRGDLAKGDNPYYGGVSDGYFLKAIDYVEKSHTGTKFYFFSDELDYVEKNIIPGLNVESELVYGPHKACEDLLLMSECDTIIASQGSFGKYAAMLNENSLLILNDNRYAASWLARKRNSIVL